MTPHFIAGWQHLPLYGFSEELLASAEARTTTLSILVEATIRQHVKWVDVDSLHSSAFVYLGYLYLVDHDDDMAITKVERVGLVKCEESEVTPEVIEAMIQGKILGKQREKYGAEWASF